MTTKIGLGFLVVVLFVGCRTPDYLPQSDEIDINEHGSYIRVICNSMADVKGELIALDTNQMVVLTRDERLCKVLPLQDVKRFWLRYASPKHYGWTIPVFTLATISHGWFLIFSAPLNLIVTISVTASGERAFRYSEQDMSYEKLRMFARYPQGIPAGISLTDIH